MNLFGLLTTKALELRADGTYTPFSSEAWGYAGQMTLLGMVMVFSVLAILWGVLAIFKLIFAGKAPKTEKPAKAPAKKSAPAKTAAKPDGAQPAPDELMAVLTAAVAAHQSNTEIIAVLTAAVAAYRAENGENGDISSFRVVSFKRGGARAWNKR